MNDRQRITFIIFTITLFFLVYTLFVSGGPNDRLEEYYRMAKYQKAIDFANICISNPEISVNDKQNILLVKGKSELALKRFQSASKTFSELLSIKDANKIDSNFFSLDHVKFISTNKN